MKRCIKWTRRVVSEDHNIISTSRITWKIHESKNHLATQPEARTVTLSIDRPRTVPSSQPRWCLGMHAISGHA